MRYEDRTGKFADAAPTWDSMTIAGKVTEPARAAVAYWKRTLTSLLTPGSSMVTP